MSLLKNHGYTDYLIIDYQNKFDYVPSKFIYDSLDQIVWPMKVRPTLTTLMTNKYFDEILKNYCQSRQLVLHYEPVQMLGYKTLDKATRARDVCTALTSDRYLLFNLNGLPFPQMSFICQHFGLEMGLMQFESYYN